MIGLLSSWWTVGGALAAVVAFVVFLLTPLGAPALAVVQALLASKAGKFIVGGVLAVLSIMAAMATARQKGKDEERAEAAKRDAQAVEVSNKIEREVHDMPADKARSELEKWGKK